jgi:hypothetical protein
MWSPRSGRPDRAAGFAETIVNEPGALRSCKTRNRMLKLRYPAHAQEYTVVYNPDTVADLGPGFAIIVATTGPDGEPFASRGWGIAASLTNGADFRVFLDATDTPTLANVANHGPIAITCGDVRTLRSRQLKGRALSVEPPTPEDRAFVRQHCDDFIAAVVEADSSTADQVEWLVPADYVACLVAVDAQYNQTPGPSAGTSLPDGST